jgi:hypothetical protein
MHGQHRDAVRSVRHFANDAAARAQSANAEADAVVKPVAPDRVVGVERPLLLGPHAV